MADFCFCPDLSPAEDRQSRDLVSLMLFRIPGLRTAERSRLSMKFSSIAELAGFSKKDIEALIQRSISENWTMDEVRALAEKDYITAERQGIGMVTLNDIEYPPLVREIYDPPAILFYRGILPNPEKPLAAMVGTRQPTPAAASCAYRLGRDLGSYGIPVVSGLALGIDAFSHRGNVDAGAPAIAVLGSGLDQIYPSSNRPLAGRIIDNGGVLISEYPPEMGPRKWHFPARNRIISALARGTIIVEAPEKSGALITADFAIEQGRDLWVTMDGVRSYRGKGTAALAAEGAKVIDSAREILAEWGLSKYNAVSPKDPEYTAWILQKDRELNTGLSLAVSIAETLGLEI